MKKRLVSFTLVLVLVFSLMTTAFAAQTNEYIENNVATKPQLEAMVSGKVDGVFSSITGTVGSYVNNLVMTTIGVGSTIKDLATPLIRKLIDDQLVNINITNSTVRDFIGNSIETVMSSKLIENLLTSDFTQAVITRTAAYATEEFFVRIGLIEDQANAVAKVVNQVWNAPLRYIDLDSTPLKSDLPIEIALLGAVPNPTYYNFNSTWNYFLGVPSSLQTVTVTGWNEFNIGLLTDVNSSTSLISNAGHYIDMINEIDYVDIIIDAAMRAIWDEILNQIDMFIQEIKNALVSTMQQGLNAMGYKITLNPRDSYASIIGQITNALTSQTVGNIQGFFTRLISSISSFFGNIFGNIFNIFR